ncbi:cytochrome c biogenesis protein ResB [Paenibacillus koleovorans]|uniref:cytochrome c biogenesis protein ResB n=1 Tax=Paenibacillus koleovorans TaxID=121608 RepID=UPI000FD93644|nr:cytochrome c biogenesis protein ResB [Paenibacillus koleovorans]
MISNTKCECGHQNHVGTVLCESCGKPLFEDTSEEVLEMRYDGVARRSQKANPSWLDKVWNFFSSVKVAIYLILATLVGAAFGTIYPQENTFLNIDPAVYYEQTYGTLGAIYYTLGLSDTYGSWWFIGLLVMIGTSLVICSLDRVLPLYRALSKQQIRKHMQFLRRQRVTFATELAFAATAGADAAQADKPAEQWIEKLAVQLRKKHYRVHTDGTALLAEKHRFSRWGPYINHIGLIIFLLAVLARGIPGWSMDHYMGFVEGQPLQIPDTSYYLKNEQFQVVYYEEHEMTEQFRQRNQTIPKTFETKAVLYECLSNCGSKTGEPVLKEVARHDILVNKPLNYKGLLAYQFDFSETPQLISVSPMLKNKKTGEQFGPIKLQMKNPSTEYTAGPYKLSLRGYFPDFGLDAKGLPMTKSNESNAPAFIFSMSGPDMPKEGQSYIYFPREIDKVNFRQDEINGAIGGNWEISANSMNDVEIANYTSYLNIRVDKALPYIWIGSAIFIIGVVMGLYWQHRRIWLRIDGGNQVTLGAHTNKNWYGLRNETASALRAIGLDTDPKQLANEVRSS